MKKAIHPGTVILVGFGFMILFMTYLVFRCTQNPVVMVSKNYYDQELVYQQQIDARNNMKGTGSEVALEKQGDQFSVRVPNQINEGLQTMDILFHHNADANLDMSYQPKQNMEGLYFLPIDKKMKGNYRVEIRMQGKEKNYQQEVQVVL